MDKLWAPWRISYIKNIKRKKCIFCQCSSRKPGSYVVFKTRYTSVILNIFPYNNGHLLVSPLRHVNRLEQLRDEEVMDLFYALKKAKKLLEKVLKPQGYNLGLNLAKDAGAGITGHLHIHIVPRWKGDTNFMPVLFNTKIISQSLDELYKQLKDAQAK
ncbi:MAG: HIT domain-containing protein [Candidatus Omnitrophica bacterium]|nr:HIT domain-containing protein [Candidatus Omnitrophota bacterium]